jgi:hypothetical protein
LQVDLGPTVPPGAVVIGSDASGFVYAQDARGAVYSFDTDGGEAKWLATDSDDFVGRLVFGNDEEMSSCMMDTMEMIRERCIELGIDPDEPPSEEYWAEEARVNKAVREHPLSTFKCPGFRFWKLSVGR